MLRKINRFMHGFTPIAIIGAAMLIYSPISLKWIGAILLLCASIFEVVNRKGFNPFFGERDGVADDVIMFFDKYSMTLFLICFLIGAYPVIMNIFLIAITIRWLFYGSKHNYPKSI